MMRRRTCLSLPILLGACSVLPERPYQATQEWPLVVPPPPTRAAPRQAPVLLVRPVRAAAGLEARGLQTLLPNGSKRTDVYDEWAAPPADAVTDQLQIWLAASGVFSAVVAPGSRLSPGYVLEAGLTALWTVQAEGQARAKLGFVLIDQHGGASNLTLQGIAAGSAPVGDDRASTRAAAEIVALAGAFADLTAQLRAQNLKA